MHESHSRKDSAADTVTSYIQTERRPNVKRLILVAALILSGCTDPSNATRILEDNGYSQVQITGYNWMACSKDDTYHTGFTAVAPGGRHVSGTVCAGVFFKNSTIRFE